MKCSHYLLLALAIMGGDTAFGGSTQKEEFCAEQLTFDFESRNLLVMAPRASMSEKEQILQLIKSDSKENGYEAHFGINLLEELINENPERSFRFMKTKLPAVGQIQILVYEGQVTAFHRTLRKAVIELTNYSGLVEFEIGDLDLFFVK